MISEYPIPQKTLTQQGLLFIISTLLMPILLFLLVLPYPWASLPGEGLSLTLNLITWVWVGLWALFFMLVAGETEIPDGKVGMLVSYRRIANECSIFLDAERI